MLLSWWGVRSSWTFLPGWSERGCAAMSRYRSANCWTSQTFCWKRAAQRRSSLRSIRRRDQVALPLANTWPPSRQKDAERIEARSRCAGQDPRPQERRVGRNKKSRPKRGYLFLTPPTARRSGLHRASRPQRQSYSITLSARRRSDCRIVSPIAFAALRSMIRSNLAGCSTGRFSGLAPCRPPSPDCRYYAFKCNGSRHTLKQRNESMGKGLVPDHAHRLVHRQAIVNSCATG